MNPSRRAFIQATGAGTLTLHVTTALGMPEAIVTSMPGVEVWQNGQPADVAGHDH